MMPHLTSSNPCLDFAKVKLKCLDHNSDCESYQFLQARTLNQQSVTYGSV